MTLLRCSPQLRLSLLWGACLMLLSTPLARAQAPCNPMSHLITEPATAFTPSNPHLVQSSSITGPSLVGSLITLVNVSATAASNAAWMTVPFRATEGFKATFSFRMQQGFVGGTMTMPDGFAFVMQPEKTDATSSLGGVSGQMGYGGLVGIAVEFDTFDSSSQGVLDTSSVPHIEVHTNYSGPNSAARSCRLSPTSTTGLVPTIMDGAVYTAEVQWVPGSGSDSLTIIVVAHSFTVKLDRALVQNMFSRGLATVGFTGSNSVDHSGVVEILSLQVETTAIAPGNSTLVGGNTGGPATASATASSAAIIQLVNACGVPLQSSPGLAIAGVSSGANVTAALTLQGGSVAPGSLTSITDLNDGTYRIQWGCSIASLPYSTYYLDIRVATVQQPAVPMIGSPFAVNVTTGLPSQNSQISPSIIQAGLLTTVIITLLDSLSNPTAVPPGRTLAFQYGVNVAVTPTKISESTYSVVVYKTVPAGPDFVYLKLTNPSLGFATFDVTLTPATLVPSLTIVTVPSITPQSEAVIKVSMRDAFGNEITGNATLMSCAIGCVSLVNGGPCLSVTNPVPGYGTAGKQVAVVFISAAQAGVWQLNCTYGGVLLPSKDFSVSVGPNAVGILQSPDASSYDARGFLRTNRPIILGVNLLDAYGNPSVTGPLTYTARLSYETAGTSTTLSSPCGIVGEFANAEASVNCVIAMDTGIMHVNFSSSLATDYQLQLLASGLVQALSPAVNMTLRIPPAPSPSLSTVASQAVAIVHTPITQVLRMRDTDGFFIYATELTAANVVGSWSGLSPAGQFVSAVVNYTAGQPVYTLEFTCLLPGLYDQTISYAGVMILPFSWHVQCMAEYSPTLSSYAIPASAAVTVTFGSSLTLRDPNGNAYTVSDATAATIVPVWTRDLSPPDMFISYTNGVGTAYNLQFTCNQVGSYTLQLRVGGQAIGGPKSLQCVAGPSVASNAVLQVQTPLRQVRAANSLGAGLLQFNFTVQPRDAQLEPTAASVAITFVPTDLLTYSASQNGTRWIFTVSVDPSSTQVPPAQGSGVDLLVLVGGSPMGPSFSITALPPMRLYEDPCADPQAVCGQSSACTRVSLNRRQPLNMSAVCVPVLLVSSVSPSAVSSESPTEIAVTLSSPLSQSALSLSVLGTPMELRRDPANPSLRFLFTLPAIRNLGMQIDPRSAGASITFDLSTSMLRNDSDTSSGAFLPRAARLPREQLRSLDTPSSLPVPATLRKLGDSPPLFYSRSVDRAVVAVNSSCVAEGLYLRQSDGACLPCDPNAFCPGGSRSGVDPVVGSAPGFVFDPAATCNRGNGFTGYLCSQCDSNHYAVEQTCRSCELDAASRQTLIATVIAAVCLFALLALGVAFMSDAKLVFFVTVIVLIQQCSFVGAVAASRFTSGGASDFFAVLGLLNFEITIFKLGCRVPQISVLTVLWYTVLFLLGAGVLLILASALYAVTRRAQIRRVQSAPSKKPQPEQLDAPLQIRSDSESAITHNPAASMHESVDLAADPSSGVRDSSASLPPLQAQPSALTRLDSTLGPTAPTRRMKVWKRRAQNSLTVLGVVIYLQLSSQILRCLFCVKIEGVLVLQVEPTTECYVGRHRDAAIFLWPAVFLFCGGLPAWCLHAVLRTRQLNLWASAATKNVYLYRNLKIRWIWFKVVQMFGLSFALALQLTLSTRANTAVRLATATLFFGVNVFFVGTVWPYFRPLGNWLAIAGGLGNAISGLLLLTILSAQVGRDSSSLGSLSGGSLFAVGFAALCVLLLLIIPARRIFSARFASSRVEMEEDALLRAGRFSALTRSRVSRGQGVYPPTKKRGPRSDSVATTHLDGEEIDDETLEDAPDADEIGAEVNVGGQAGSGELALPSRTAHRHSILHTARDSEDFGSGLAAGRHNGKHVLFADGVEQIAEGVEMAEITPTVASDPDPELTSHADPRAAANPLGSTASGERLDFADINTNEDVEIVQQQDL